MELEAKDGARTATTKERIYVGGLGEHVTEVDLHKILSSIGARVESVDIIRTKGRSFAYIDFIPASDKALAKLFSTYNGCVWKGGKLRLERAKEHYLARLRREWAEDAEISSAPGQCDDADKSNSTPEKISKKLPSSEKKQLQIFFPRLRKMKSLPFSGTGKHKYSFQRVQVPSLPVHFCDCEEHAVPFHIDKEKQTTDVLAQNGGVDEEEFNIMSSVMNKLLKRESESNIVDEEPQLAQEADQLHETKSDNEADEDNLIINMVTTVDGTPTLLEGQGWERNSRNKELKFNKKRASRDRPYEDKRKIQKSDLVTPEKKMKSLPSGQVSDGEFVSAIPGSKGNIQNQSNEPGVFLGAQSYQPELDIQQPTTNLSWSQKNSWKELIGNKDNNTFSVSQILPSIGPAKEDPPQKPLKFQKRDAVPPKTKKKLIVDKQNNDGEFVSAIPESKSEIVPHSNESKMLLDSQSTELESGTQQLMFNFSPSQQSSSKELGDKDNSISSESKSLPIIGSAKDHQRSDYVSVPVPSENKSQTLVSHDKVEGQPGITQKPEGLVDSQPTKQGTSSNKSGRGAAWLQKSSWTQLVRESNPTFSMSQILPGISSEKQELPETKTVDPANSMDSKHCELSYQGKVESSKGAHRAPQIGKPPILSAGTSMDNLPTFNVLGSCPEKKLQTISGNQEAFTSLTEKKGDSTLKATPRVADSSIGETCTFMRSTASLKEWANTKAALSKRKGKDK